MQTSWMEDHLSPLRLPVNSISTKTLISASARWAACWYEQNTRLRWNTLETSGFWAWSK